MKKIFFVFVLCALSFSFQSCSDDGDDDTTVTTTTGTTSTTGNPSTGNGITFTSAGSLKLSFNHTFGNTPLALSPATYVTGAMDTIKVTELRYYISHVALTTGVGTKVNLGNHNLLDFTAGQSSDIILTGVPAGTYTSIEYIVGVDSVANSSGAQQGDLDPSNGMFWTWNTGYVYLRLKGRYATDNNSYSFDIGGSNNRMNVSHDLSTYKVSGSSPTAVVKFDLSRVFNAPNQYDLKIDVDEIHSSGSPGLLKLKPNVTGAFVLTGIQ